MVCKRLHNSIGEKVKPVVEEFWNDLATSKSFEKLIDMSKKYKFTVIGGWAVYLITSRHKSKDIDIIIDYHELLKIKDEYSIEKNDRLKKYEIKTGEFDIDIYLPSYSKLMLPIKEIISNPISIKGMNVPRPEVLLILKQGAEIDRRSSIKGRKDMIDIITLLVFSNFDVSFYRLLLKDHGIEFLESELTGIIRRFDLKDLKYIGLNAKGFSNWKNDFLHKLKVN